MVDLVVANHDSISQLNKDLLKKEQDLQNIKQYLVAAKAHHEK